MPKNKINPGYSANNPEPPEYKESGLLPNEDALHSAEEYIYGATDATQDNQTKNERGGHTHGTIQ
ncbi:Hypothetical protein LUCI_3467 [Lucifera butyrica]|uniref:Uncharacterized protein n=1 Tax=Lucifera butyrica TaxID=1351585 RepID=A0A498RGF9_9FIRM|nr:hypothetical protein [Lucifera butyrica]VBB08198.1 Hypothetical protein LUCI_3467 [Lucifera butyrica]